VASRLNRLHRFALFVGTRVMVKVSECIFVKFGNLWYLIKCKVFIIGIANLQKDLKSLDIYINKYWLQTYSGQMLRVFEQWAYILCLVNYFHTLWRDTTMICVFMKYPPLKSTGKLVFISITFPLRFWTLISMTIVWVKRNSILNNGTAEWKSCTCSTNYSKLQWENCTSNRALQYELVT
jgi:hypothetical protein